MQSYPTCNPADLDSLTRYARLKARLVNQISRSSPIICLQEVSRDWASKLISFFEQKNYGFVYSLYGANYSGFMGTAIAWPRTKYNLQDTLLKRLADTCEWPETSPSTTTMAAPNTDFYDPWDEAKKRDNVVILARLQPVNFPRNFVVSTYHMPCQYGSDPRMKMMNIHASLLLQYTQQWANQDPLILAGDFNFYPVDSPYSLVLCGQLPSDHPQAPVPTPIIKGNPSGNFERMRSAYKECGGEPEFTAFAETKSEVLDYVFLSKEWEVVSVIRAPSAKEFWNSGVRGFPNLTEPSDHILIGADLHITLK